MWIKILLLFFVFSFLFRTDYSFDQDLGRHLKLGEIIIKTGNVPRINLFSYTNPDFPFINTRFQSCYYSFVCLADLKNYSKRKFSFTFADRFYFPACFERTTGAAPGN